VAGIGLLDGVHCECANGVRHEVVISHEESAPKFEKDKYLGETLNFNGLYQPAALKA
jgi:hypothetical protein